MFHEAKKNPLKVAGNKLAAFVKRNFSQVIFKDFSRNNYSNPCCFVKIKRQEEKKNGTMFLVHY